MADLGEFELIERYFTRPARRAALGIGDDCALLAPTPGMQLAVSSDMLVEGRHFLSTVAPERLGHKALAVNLSDLAACGARPLAFTLALALPRADEAFLDGFARGLFALADRARLRAGRRRHHARPAHHLHHRLRRGARRRGAAALGRARRRRRLGQRHARRRAPGARGVPRHASRSTPALRARCAARWSCRSRASRSACALRGVATSAIDVSDGLLGDLGHILRRSGVGATVDVDALPRSAVLAAQPLALQRECLLAGGDDYELVFTAPASRRDAVAAAPRARRRRRSRASAGSRPAPACASSTRGGADGRQRSSARSTTSAPEPTRR